MSTFLFALASIASSVAAQFCLKAGMSSDSIRSHLLHAFDSSTVLAVVSNSYILGGFALYGLGAVAWLGVLSQWDVSKAYPLVGLGFAFTVAIGWFIGEHITFARAAGVAMICIGVSLVGRS